MLERRVAKRPYYILNDSMLEFWFRYVNRATSLINADNGESYYYASVKDHLHDYMGKVFEKMAKEYLLAHAGIGDLPILTDIVDYQDIVFDEDKKKKQIEIDLLGKNRKQILLIGECKFKSFQFDKAEYVKENAKGCKLISLDEMYNI